MRSGQQNKRGRGRGGNNNNFNRKGANPLTRTYDSTGPDVKVRGTAQHVAEKYMSLARDSQSSGDRVMAENYLQHAEHYNRIIAAAQAQMQDRSQRDDRSDNDDSDDNQANGNQAFGDERDDRNDRNDRAERNDRPERAERNDRPERSDRNDRNDRRNNPRRQETSVDADGPQPVIDGTPAEVAAKEVEGQPLEKGRRRAAAGSRPRRTKRGAQETAGEGNAPEGSDVSDASGAAEDGDAAKKPARRRRAPKAEAGDDAGNREDAPALAEAASE